jgi:hypothetical protein
MRNINRQFRVERLEARFLLAALVDAEQATTIASTQLAEAASIDFSEVQGLRGAALEIRFDNERLRVDPRDVRAGSAWGGKGMSIANVDNEEGTINVFVFSARESEVGHGSLVEIDFRRSHNIPDESPPTIDVNRLRLNDQEISFSEAIVYSDNATIPGDTPKLSLQFNITPEGETTAAPDDQPNADEGAVASLDLTALAINHNNPLVNRDDMDWQDAQWQDSGTVLQHFEDDQEETSDLLLLMLAYASEHSEGLEGYGGSDDHRQPADIVCWPKSFVLRDVDLALMDLMSMPDELVGPIAPQSDPEQARPDVTSKVRQQDPVSETATVLADWPFEQPTRSAADFSFIWTVRQRKSVLKQAGFASSPILAPPPKRLSNLLSVTTTNDDLEAIE